jgi:hypothetical protein
MLMMWWNWLWIGGSYLGDHGHWDFTERKLSWCAFAKTDVVVSGENRDALQNAKRRQK